MLGMLFFFAQLGWANDWKIFCMPEKHLDVGWSYLPADALDQGYPGSVEEYQVFSLARTLKVREETERYPHDAQYRWFIDAAWQLEQAEKYQPDLIPRLRQLVNAGEFGFNPIYANLHTMAIGHEQLMRMMAYGRILETEGFRRSRVASASDAFSVGWGYASALASAGVKYFIKGTWYTGPSVRPGVSMVEPAPLFRWVGPDGKKVLFFYFDSYQVMAGDRNWGESLNQETVEKTVTKYEKLRQEGKWPYDAFPMFGSEADWGIPDTSNSNFIQEWNKTHPSARLIMSTPEDFFDYIEAHFADKVPEVRGGWGVSHDVEEATAAKPGARARANDHLLLAAEAFGSIIPDPSAGGLSTYAFRQAWLKQVLYHEHSFGILETGPSPQSRRQYAWRNGLTEQVEAVARTALDTVLMTLASQISGGGNERFACFNSLSFPHADLAEVQVEASHGSEPLKVVDAETGKELPSQTQETEGKRSIRFLILAPALGYRTIRVESGATAAGAAVKADARARTLENEFYRLTLTADGSIASLLDKELELELFDAAGAYRGNHFIFKDDAWRDHSPDTAEIGVEGQGQVSATLRAVAAPMGIFPRSTRRYTLYAGLKRLDITNSFTKEPGHTNSAETVFYAFPFAASGGVFHLDIPGVVVRYPDEFRPETEWTYMPAQSFISASNDKVTIIVAAREAPNFAFKSMRKFFAHELLPDLDNTTVFAMPLTKQSVNRHDYDYEGGTYEFHYALTSARGGFRAADALRFGWGFQRGFQVAPVTNSHGSLPPSHSYLRIDPGNVLVSALKPADDGRGLIVRLWNPGDQVVMAKVSLPDTPVSAGLTTDLLERDTGGRYEMVAGSIGVPCGPREFVTVRLLTGKVP
jgi:hypothetical protein